MNKDEAFSVFGSKPVYEVPEVVDLAKTGEGVGVCTHGTSEVFACHDGSIAINVCSSGSGYW